MRNRKSIYHMCDIKHDLQTPLFHKLSHFLRPHSPLERDVLYGQPFKPL